MIIASLNSDVRDHDELRSVVEETTDYQVCSGDFDDIIDPWNDGGLRLQVVHGYEDEKGGFEEVACVLYHEGDLREGRGAEMGLSEETIARYLPKLS